MEDQRTQFMAEWLTGEWSFAELCREFEVSRKTGYKWRARYEADGPSGLANRTSAPHEHPNAVPADVEARIVALRQRHPSWGPRKRRGYLLGRDAGKPEAQRTAWPSIRTFANVLGRNGLAAMRRLRKPCGPPPRELSAADQPNAVWTMDFKGWFRCGDGTRCDPFTLLDVASRYLLRCVALPRLDGVTVQGVLESAFRQYGLPAVLRSDNGPPFASQSLAGMSRLSLWLIRLGVRPERIEEGKPQQNGRLERLHRTLKAECATPAAWTLASQQRRFELWRLEYNDERPHQALDEATPASWYAGSSRRFQRRPRPFSYPPGTCLRLVRRTGCIRWERGLLDLGQAYVGETVALRGLGDPEQRYWRLYYQRQPLAVFDERYGIYLPVAHAERVVAACNGQEGWHW